jgi:DNA-binding PadR family transcriptional regulator
LSNAALRLTDDEGTLLSLLLRVQPATAYQLSKIYADSPVSNFGTSKGKIYPLIRRLKERRLVKGTSVAGDARGSEELEATAEGKRAVSLWVKEIKPTHLLLEDPLRTKLQSFHLLSASEQREWVTAAKAQLKEKLDQVEAYAGEVEVPNKQLVHDNAVSSLKARLARLGRPERSLSPTTKN